jgi:predicted PurR-regulated permease PerM
MNEGNPPGSESEQRAASRLLDVLIRAGLTLAMATLCYRVFSPFLTLTAWAVSLAVALYPLHQALAAKMRAKQGRLIAVRRSVQPVRPRVLVCR